MKLLSLKLITASIILLTSSKSTMATSPYPSPSVGIKYNYETVDTGARENGRSLVLLPQVPMFGKDSVYAKNEKMRKTLFVMNLGRAIEESLVAYEKASCPEFPPIHPYPHPRITPPGDSFPRPPICRGDRTEVGQKLLAKLEELKANMFDYQHLIASMKVVEALDLTTKLATNMVEGKPLYNRHSHLEMRALSTTSVGSGSLNLTAGGAQDMAFFEKVVEEGQVPAPSSFTIEGMMSEFDLSLGHGCEKLMCVRPEVAVNKAAKKLYVQIGTSSNVDADSFSRRALNLSIVLDISGSMGATDGTEKTRLAWAKEALVKTIHELSEDDYLSVVLFNGQSEIFMHPTQVTDKMALIERIQTIQKKGSTNLEAGLRDGYNLVAANLQEGYENRVILISDAGLNTGVTNEGQIMTMVADFASQNIGLTAVGLGLNFNADLINAITQSKGGNYIFVQSGKRMYKFFENFDYLVTPVIAHFNAQLEVYGVKAKLAKTYGIPTKEGEPVRDLMNVRTLFFSEGGGAMVLEYDLL